jgi:hypothetical protein
MRVWFRIGGNKSWLIIVICMSSDDDSMEETKRRFEKYPLESMLFTLITQKFISMYTELYPNPGLVYKEIKFSMGKLPGANNYVLDFDDAGRILIGAIAGTIAESIYLTLEKYEEGIQAIARDSAKQYVKEVNPWGL